MTSDKCTSATSNRFTVLEIETNTNDGEPINTPFFYMPKHNPSSRDQSGKEDYPSDSPPVY